MTSSDVLDTCFAVQLQRAADLLIEGVDLVLAGLKKRALEHKYTPTVGRSHGIHAEPVTFGLKLVGYYAEFVRARARLVTARAEISTCAISGAVGTFANVSPEVEAYVADKMGLSVEPVSSQVIPRDRHARLLRGFRPSSPRRSSAWPSKSATCNAPRCWKPRSSSRPARRAHRPCRTSAIRC